MERRVVITRLGAVTPLGLTVDTTWEKLCQGVEAKASFPDGRNGQVRVTVSIGLAFYPSDAADEVALMSRADSALYRAKESGKNRVSL